MTDARALAADLLQGAACSDPGRARTNNEDLPLLDAPRGILGVIDGVGGQAGGEVAAAIARDVILQRLARPLGTPEEKVREAIAIANNEIFRRSQESLDLRGMACVVTLALIADGRLVAGHVGDTRLYKIRGNGLRKLTRDHSPVGEREDAGEIGEVEAMHHPRRNEVFRDVGSIFRDKDEAEFVDVIDEPFEPDCALLVCSDGLSDMLPASTIGHIVRQHAGNPARVTEALVAAANDAGGKDNVTVVYAEGPLFAASTRGELIDTLTPTEPLPDRQPRAALPEPLASARPGMARRVSTAIVRSRITWFVLGTALGAAGAVALFFYVARTQVASPRTLVVSATGGTPFLTIGQALAAAQRGDSVRIEPGAYEEQLVLRDGVDVSARVPGTVTLHRPRGLHPSAATLASGTAAQVRVSGLKIVSPERPGGVAVQAGYASNLSLELLDIAGHGEPALAVSPGASLSLQGSRVHMAGTVLSVFDDAQASVVNNVFVRSVRGAAAPVVAGASARLTLSGNVFAGFDADLVPGLTPARRAELLNMNTVVAPAPAPPPVRARQRAR